MPSLFLLGRTLCAPPANARIPRTPAATPRPDHPPQLACDSKTRGGGRSQISQQPGTHARVAFFFSFWLARGAIPPFSFFLFAPPRPFCVR